MVSIRKYITLIENQSEQIGNWKNRHVWHGTSKKDAKQIITTGIKIEKSSGGYFGYGFYVADNPELAKSNYADWAEDEDSIDKEGVVLEFKFTKNAHILDLRKSKDWDIWRDGKFENLMREPSMISMIVRRGVDGVYDNSFGGVCVYNPKVLNFIRVWSGVIEDAFQTQFVNKTNMLDEYAIGGLRRCTAVTANALLKHFHKKPILLGDVPETDVGVLEILTKERLAYKPIPIVVGKTVQQFVNTYSRGAWYIVTQGHAIAIVNGEIFDSEIRGADGRKILQAYEITAI